jgi:hypothetical protein
MAGAKPPILLPGSRVSKIARILTDSPAYTRVVVGEPHIIESISRPVLAACGNSQSQ